MKSRKKSLQGRDLIYSNNFVFTFYCSTNYTIHHESTTIVKRLNKHSLILCAVVIQWYNKSFDMLSKSKKYMLPAAGLFEVAGWFFIICKVWHTDSKQAGTNKTFTLSKTRNRIAIIDVENCFNQNHTSFKTFLKLFLNHYVLFCISSAS